MKRLWYEALAFVIVVPVLLFTLVVPLLNVASIVGNIAGFTLLGIIGIEGGYLARRIINQFSERIDG